MGSGVGRVGTRHRIALLPRRQSAEQRRTPGGAVQNLRYDAKTNTTTADVLVKYTYYGDADLNGVINGADYALIDNTINQISASNLNPLLLDAMGGDKIAVGPPYYAATFAPIFFALLLLVPFGPQLGWRPRRLPSAALVAATSARRARRRRRCPR